MNRWVAIAALALSSSAFGLTYDSGGGGGGFSVGGTVGGADAGSLLYVSTGGLVDTDTNLEISTSNAPGFIVPVSSFTMNPTAAGESRGWSIVGTFAGSTAGQLPSSLWADMFYNQSGAATTDHGGAIFGRVTTDAGVTGFSFGVEGNAHCRSEIQTASCVGVIGHGVFRHDTSTPTAPVIGLNARAEVTDNAIAVNRSTGQVMGVRSEAYGGDARSRLAFYAPLSDNMNVFLGPVIKVPLSAQTVTAGAVIIATNSCGGMKQITSGGDVTTDTSNTFTAPSASTSSTAGLTSGCWMDVTNVGSNVITLDANASFLTYGGIDVSLRSGSTVRVQNNGTQWVQVSPVSYIALGDIYVSSVTASDSVATSGQFGNAGQVSITPGDWSVSATCDIAANGATVTQTAMAISVNSGNTTTDHVRGQNQIQLALPGTVSTGGSIGSYRVAVAAATTVYVKAQATYSAATPTRACSIVAERR